MTPLRPESTNPDRQKPQPIAPPIPVTNRNAPPSLDRGPPAMANRPATETGKSPIAPGTASSLAKRWKLAILAAVAAAVVVVGLPFLGGASESTHENYPSIREASARPNGQFVWKNLDGTSVLLSGIAIGEADRDEKTTEAIKTAIATGDEAQIEAALAAAQDPTTTAPAKNSVSLAPPTPVYPPTVKAASPVPVAAPSAVALAPQPTLSAGLRREVLRGDTEFYHIFLFDCCAEDGDIVEILLDGVPFRTVKLTNRGATLSVPIAVNANTRIQIRGIYDGGGGITVCCRTSQGRTFLRAMEVGEVETLGIVKGK